MLHKETIENVKGYLGEIERFIDSAPTDKRREAKAYLDGLRGMVTRAVEDSCPLDRPKVKK